MAWPREQGHFELPMCTTAVPSHWQLLDNDHVSVDHPNTFILVHFRPLLLRRIEIFETHRHLVTTVCLLLICFLTALLPPHFWPVPMGKRSLRT